MIILRNKIYAEPSPSPTGKEVVGKSNPKSWSEGLSGFGNNPFPSSSVRLSGGGESMPDMADLTKTVRATTKSANMIQKVMSDTPMGLTYVDQVKKKKSHIANIIRKQTNPILTRSKKTLQNLPVMSEENKVKQRKKLDAIRFYLDHSTKGLDKVAEKIYSEERMPVSAADMRKAETDGVVQRRPDGKWGIIAKKKRLWWSAGYDSKESAEAALRAYHAGRH